MRTTIAFSAWRALFLALALALVAAPLASARAVDVEVLGPRDVLVEPLEVRDVDAEPFEVRDVDLEPLETREVDLEPLEARSDLSKRALWPDIDPFYKPPKGFESAEPGTVFRSRRIIPAFWGIIPSPVETWQLLYRTTDAKGKPITTVTTVFKPIHAKLDRFVSFHTAYDSSNTRCSPSYTYQLLAIPEEIVTQQERLVLAVWLLSGYIVSSPDYEGPDAAYGVGRVHGPGVLDSMRAVRNFGKKLGLTTDNPAIFGTGYSGGGIATGWAAALQGKYAPELNIKGWASGGTPANLTSTLLTVDGTLFSGFAVIAVNGLLKPTAYKAELQPVVDKILTTSGKLSLGIANSLCAVGAVISFLWKSILATSFQKLGSGLVVEPTIRGVLDHLNLGIEADETPVAPIQLYHGSKDELVPYGPAEKLATAWCENGATVHLSTFAAGGHITTEPLGILGALKFASEAFSDKIKPGCVRDTHLDETLNPIAWAVNIEPIGFKLIELIAHVGKGDEKLLKNPLLLQQPIGL